MRHSDRDLSVETMTGELGALSRFEGEKVISLETYRRNGQPVRTPIWFLKENGILYVHTDDSTGKVKRIRQNSKVAVAPSHFRGKPKAEFIEARAELETSPGTVEKYRSQIYKKYGFQGTFTKFLQRFSRSKANDIIIVIHP
jgi:PPOX class probable F420-dependent enzyme